MKTPLSRSRSSVIALAGLLAVAAGVIALLALDWDTSPGNTDTPLGHSEASDSEQPLGQSRGSGGHGPGDTRGSGGHASSDTRNSDSVTPDAQPGSADESSAPGSATNGEQATDSESESAGDVDLDVRPRRGTRAERDAWINQPQPYPEHIDELPPWQITWAEDRRRRAAGLSVNHYAHPPGPIYDDDRDLYQIAHIDPSPPRLLYLYTWGEPRPDDLQDWEDLPLVDAFLEEFGLWMQHDDDRYVVGFQAADGRFFRAGSGSQWDPRPFEEVPSGRNIPNVGVQRLYAVEGYSAIQFVRVRGGYAVPGLPVVDHRDTPEAENIFVTFEGYPRFAIDLLTAIYERDRDRSRMRLPKMWVIEPEIVVIPRLPQ